MKNITFIDGQNLYLGTLSSEIPWKIDFFRFRRYLTEKYKVEKAYYYIGFVKDKNASLYEKIQEAGFILIFREHHVLMETTKKGNVDSDIIFDIMKKLYYKESFDKLILVSGDGDYKKLVDFLIEEEKFLTMLFPNKKFASSLYKQITATYFNNLDEPHIKKKIGIQKKKKET